MQACRGRMDLQFKPKKMPKSFEPLQRSLHLDWEDWEVIPVGLELLDIGDESTSILTEREVIGGSTNGLLKKHPPETFIINNKIK